MIYFGLILAGLWLGSMYYWDTTFLLYFLALFLTFFIFFKYALRKNTKK